MSGNRKEPYIEYIYISYIKSFLNILLIKLSQLTVDKIRRMSEQAQGLQVYNTIDNVDFDPFYKTFSMYFWPPKMRKNKML